MSKKLSRELIIQKIRSDRLENIKNLNLWGTNLDDVSLLKEMPNLEIVSLSVNKIRTLKPFSFLPKLRELYLRKNMIADLNEIKYLIDNNNLKILWLSENPICENPNYRNIIISVLPQIIKLDDIIISEEERINANKGISIQMSQIKNRKDNNENDIFEEYENVKFKKYKNKNYNNSDEDDNNNFIDDSYNHKKNYNSKNSQRNKDINIYDNDFLSNNSEFNDYNQYNDRKKNNKIDNYNREILRDDYEDIKYKNKRKKNNNYYYNDDNYYDRYNYRDDEKIYYRRKYNNKTVLNCVMMLIDELNNNELDIVKRKIEIIQNNKY